MVTLYIHYSKRNQFSLPGEDKFFAGVRTYIPSVSKDGDEWSVYLPYGSYAGGYESESAAITAAINHALASGWVEDPGLAKRRAEKEVALRMEGKLKFGGPMMNRADNESARAEILATT